MKVLSLSLILLVALKTSIAVVTPRELIALDQDYVEDNVEGLLATDVKRNLSSKKSKKSKKKKKKKTKVCQKKQDKPHNKIPETLVKKGFDTLVTALEAADLVDILSKPGPYTVFAPTDKAFAALPNDLLSCLLLPGNIGALTSILYYHAVDDTAYSCKLKNGQMIKTLNGEVEVYKEYKSSVPVINDANIITANVLATNGVIHGIDKVLVPPSVDVESFMLACPRTVCNKEREAPTLNVLNTLTSAGSFTTLITIINKNATMVEAISRPGTGFTLFAPTDDAFAAIPELECLLLPENWETLGLILQYHFVSDIVYTCDLKNGQTIEAITGIELEVYKKYKDSVPMINSANVVEANVLATNGIIHVIDAVLVPPLDPYTLEDFLTGCS